MKRISNTVGVLLLSLSAYSYPEAVTIPEIDFIYDLGMDKSFDFSGGEVHECGSKLYRTSSTTEDSINRKFSVILTAFAAGKSVVLNTRRLFW